MNIHFNDFNESFLKVETDDWGIEQEISEFFSFFADGYKFTPKFRSGQWDGRIRLFDLRNKQLPKGLLKIAVRFCKDRGYAFSMDMSLQPKTGISVDAINTFIDSIPISTKGIDIELRDYQRDAVIQSISYYRNLLISPTQSGKSAILYYKIRWHISQGHNILLIVPTTQLVSQMVGDFIDYSTGNGFDVGEHCQMLFAGKEKEFTKQVMIQTWQSLAAMAKSQKHLFQLIVDRTDVACFDECLDGDTLIEMPDGQKKKIKELKAGENVITRNEKTGKLENKPIVKVHNNITPHTEKMFRIKMTDGQEINITGNHNVFLEQGVWKRADELGVGDIINSM